MTAIGARRPRPAARAAAAPAPRSGRVPAGPPPRDRTAGVVRPQHRVAPARRQRGRAAVQDWRRTSADPTHPARDPRSRLPFGRRRYVLLCLALPCWSAPMRRSRSAASPRGDHRRRRRSERSPPPASRFDLEGREERARPRGRRAAAARARCARARRGRRGRLRPRRWRRALRRRATRAGGLLAAPARPVHDRRRRVRRPAGGAHCRARAGHRRACATGRSATAHPPPARRPGRSTTTSWPRTKLAYLTRQRRALTRRITELSGLVAEVRAEGIAMVDPSDELTDVRMPEIGTDGHVACSSPSTWPAAGRDGTALPGRRAARARAPARAASIARTGGGARRDPGAEVGAGRARARTAGSAAARSAAPADAVRPLPGAGRRVRGLAAPGALARTETARREEPARTRAASVGSRCGSGWSISSTTTARSSGSATAGCCCGATTAPASPRCWR